MKHYDKIALFYKDLHENQTVEYVKAMRAKYAPLDKREMTIWEAFDFLNEIVDESDPDTESSQVCLRIYVSVTFPLNCFPRMFMLTRLVRRAVVSTPMRSMTGSTLLASFMISARFCATPLMASLSGLLLATRIPLAAPSQTTLSTLSFSRRILTRRTLATTPSMASTSPTAASTMFS